MAYQARGRDPLFDSTTQASIEKRGKELIGIALFILGLMAAAMIASYTPDDPSWLSATDAPVQNWMGRTGASLAAPFFMIVGWGSWAAAFILCAWGLRFALHVGAERALWRLVFAPIAIALAAIYAATLVPGPSWTHNFGLGGLFGDTVLGTLLVMLPFGAATGLKLLSLALGVMTVIALAFVAGTTFAELRRAARFLLVGLIVTYAAILAVLGRGASETVRAAQGLQARQAERAAERRAQAEAMAAEAAEIAAAEAAIPAAPRVHRVEEPSLVDEPMIEPVEEAAPAEEQKAGFLSRVPLIGRRAEPPLTAAPVAEPQEEDRVKARITDAIKSRARANPAVQFESAAPLTKGRGRGPDPLLLDTSHPVELPPEPPLTAVQAPSIPAEVEAPAAAPVAINLPPLPESELVEDMPPAAPVFRPAARVAEAQPEARKVVQQARKSVPQSKRARAEAQPQLAFEDRAAAYELPPLSLLSSPDLVKRHQLSDEALEANARMLESVLDDYGVKGEIVSVRPGPVVTMYELEPAPGLKASRVIGLADDIARSMSALSARVSTVPGRSVIGIELPNEQREMVNFREILSGRDYGDGAHKLPLVLGKDIGGDHVVSNLAKMPHLLIAGTTGSGKSVAINTMIMSLLYKLTPDDCRLIMIDPKMLELSVYDGIPHLLSPVVTDPKKAVVALKWVVGEMEERYRKMSKMGVRNIDGYNSRVADALSKGETFSRTVQTGFDDETGEPVFETEEIMPEKMPFIVVIVDEMADLMMVAGKEIEACIQRLAQMARASGIHLIMATQRPSVDVITGTIKANFPTRISFQVTSKIDSRTILGEMGAEQLLGMGDMLYMAGGGKITRCHAPFVSDEEVEEIVNHLKAFGPPDYVSGVVSGPEDDKADNIDAVLGLNTGGNTNGEDALYDQAVQIVITDRKCSTSYIQRKLGIGYNKAARLVEQMEDEGLVSSANHVGKREILVPEQA
ncbi:DNA translocase FtsK [Pseudaestuariivita atlantica]|uniref:DNA translocase FtsK n=1 Tax=Pseudaestuariivita atlantica TaxID=1317121 RepID=A0A0L1JQ31_9RHOB|nr:DNA translocase FtsK [Pseudaestuariivita atlantica]KNG93493.1 cell division protein FtsK [Pseudaestuariivita atlantica]